MPDPIAEALLRPGHAKDLDVLETHLRQYGIDDVEPLAGGASSVVLSAGDRVLRLTQGMPATRPAIPEVLQAEASGMVGYIGWEVLPRAQTEAITENDVHAMGAALVRQGYRFSDAGTDNLGRYEGKLVVLDPGAISPKPAKELDVKDTRQPVEDEHKAGTDPPESKTLEAEAAPAEDESLSLEDAYRLLVGDEDDGSGLTDENLEKLIQRVEKEALGGADQTPGTTGTPAAQAPGTAASSLGSANTPSEAVMPPSPMPPPNPSPSTATAGTVPGSALGALLGAVFRREGADAAGMKQTTPPAESARFTVSKAKLEQFRRRYGERLLSEIETSAGQLEAAANAWESSPAGQAFLAKVDAGRKPGESREQAFQELTPEGRLAGLRQEMDAQSGTPAWEPYRKAARAFDEFDKRVRRALDVHRRGDAAVDLDALEAIVQRVKPISDKIPPDGRRRWEELEKIAAAIVQIVRQMFGKDQEPSASPAP